MSVNDSIRDIVILRSVLLEQLKSNYANKLKRTYLDILNDMLKQLNTYNEVNIINVNKVIKELHQRIKPEITLLTDLQSLALDEASYTVTAMNAVIGAEIFKKIPKDSTLLKIANSELFQGYTINQIMKDFDTKIAFDVQGAVKLAVINGETIPEIRQRLNKILNVKVNQAEAIARTATATLVNQVRDEVYNENSDVIKGLQWIATLDGRTRIEHAIRNNLTWSFRDKKPIGHNLPFRQTPDGVNCRCVLIPVLKSWQELGIDDLEEIPIGTRSSMDGQVSKDLSFTDWLKSKDDAFVEKYLGKKRADLFLDGKITLSDLVSKGRVLTLKELQEKLK